MKDEFYLLSPDDADWEYMAEWVIHDAIAKYIYQPDRKGRFGYVQVAYDNDGDENPNMYTYRYGVNARYIKSRKVWRIEASIQGIKLTKMRYASLLETEYETSSMGHDDWVSSAVTDVSDVFEAASEVISDEFDSNAESRRLLGLLYDAIIDEATGANLNEITRDDIFYLDGVAQDVINMGLDTETIHEKDGGYVILVSFIRRSLNKLM